jgi:hypothetical protein
MIEMHVMSFVLALFDAAVVGLFVGFVIGQTMGVK